MTDLVPLSVSSHPANPPDLARPEIDLPMRRCVALLKEPWREGRLPQDCLPDDVRKQLRTRADHLRAKVAVEISPDRLWEESRKFALHYPINRGISDTDLKLSLGALMSAFALIPEWVVVKVLSPATISTLARPEVMPNVFHLAQLAKKEIDKVWAEINAIESVLGAPIEQPRVLSEETPEDRKAVVAKHWTEGVRRKISPGRAAPSLESLHDRIVMATGMDHQEARQKLDSIPDLKNPPPGDRLYADRRQDQEDFAAVADAQVLRHNRSAGIDDDLPVSIPFARLFVQQFPEIRMRARKTTSDD